MTTFQKMIFGVIIFVALIGLIFNLDVVLFSIFRSIITVAIIVGIIYLVYFFFFLTQDQRDYKKRVWKNKFKGRR
ncbi:SA1362 family protein [Staphylococcus pseudintermedius]|uniref:SA1362 family protein n=1 Tax=Staphylococcus pseudintermedius TaxID=283734 RepID=UPI00398154C5